MTTTADALKQVLQEMRAMSPEELKADLERHKNGPLAVAMREASEFLASEIGQNALHKAGVLVTQADVKDSKED